jgi:hypothetical protein
MRQRVLVLLFVLVSLAGPAAADMPSHIDENVKQARLAGKGTYTWFGLRIYDAELWVGDQGCAGDAPYVLVLRYARKLDGVKIAQASADEMEKLGAGSISQRAAWLARMKEIFPDVKEGTRISGVFLPGAGVRFYLDGQALASVPDPDFARAFFAIWLDPKTSAKSLRAALLKDAGPR